MKKIIKLTRLTGKMGAKGPAIAETIQKLFMVEYGETIKEDDMGPQIQECMLRL